MKKLLLLLCTLLGTAGAWAATDVTVIQSSSDASTYGTLTGTTFTTNSASGMEGVTIEGIKGTTATSFSYGACLGITQVSSGTVTMTAPEGYVILGYTLTGRLNTYAAVFTLTPSAGGSAVALTTGGKTVSAAGLDAQTASFSYSCGSTNSFYIPSMVITVGTAAEAEANKARVSAYNKAQEFPALIMLTQTAYMSSTNLWTSDAADESEGWLDRLTDGDLTNYFHSDWHNTYSGTHYIEATLPDAVNKLHLYYYTRSTGTGCPTNITVNGSVDGTTWVEGIATINSNMPTTASTGFFSDALSFTDSYSHFRFMVNSTNSGTNSWFCLAEANLYSATDATAEAMTLCKIAANDLTDAQIARIDALDTELRSTTVNVTYQLYESDGTTLASSTTVEQLKNSEVNVPSSLTAATYYDYTIQGTIGTTDCTIKVIRTVKSNVVIELTGLDNSKCYTIRNNRGAWAVDSDATEVNSTNANGLNLAFSSEDTKQQFAIISYEGKYYLYSVGESKFAYKDGTKLSLTSNVTSNVENSPVTFTASTAGDATMSPIIMTIGDYYFGIHPSKTPNVYNYQYANDNGNVALIEEAGSFDAATALAALYEYFHPSYTVTYIVKDSNNKTLFTSDPVGTTQGAQITTLPEEYQFANFYTYSTVSVTISNSGNTNVTFTATPKEDPLFSYTADTTNPVWYYLKMKDASYATYVADGTPNVTLPTSYTLGDNNAQWAFVGEPYAGFQIINRAATGLVLGSGSAANDGNTGGNTYATMAAAGSQTYEKFVVMPSSYLTDGFFLFNEEGYALNRRSTENLAYWTSGYDLGSTFTVEEASDNYYSRVETEILPYLETSMIGKIFGISQTGATSIQSTYSTQLTNKNFTLAEYQEAKATFDASILYPEDGKYYLVKNTYNDKYLRVAEHGVHGQVFADLEYDQAIQNDSARVFVRYINNKPYLLSGGYYFNWVYGTTDGYEAYTTEARASDKYAHFVSVAPGVGAFSLALGNGVDNYAYALNPGFYALKNGTTVVAGSTNGSASEYAHWTFEEITVEADGDVNMDGETTVDDVADLVAYLVGKANIAGGMSVNQNAADLDNNGTITLRDVTLLVNKIKNAQ